MSLPDMVSRLPDFHQWPHNDKIKFIGWTLHTLEKKERFAQRDIRLAYEALKCEQPSNIGSYLKSLEQRKPKALLKDSKGYYIPQSTRNELAAKYAERDATVIVHRLLSELPDKISPLAEKQYLSEALTCFRHGAFRASIVMTWNLGFDHLLEFVLNHRLAAFNSAIAVRYPKKAGLIISSKDSFEDLKESEIIEVCKNAAIVSGNVGKILVEKLVRRNLAAHPSNISITQLQAEDFISDIVTNVILKLV